MSKKSCQKRQERPNFSKKNKDKLNRQVRESDPYYAITGNTIKCKSCEQIKTFTGKNNQVYYSLKSNIDVREEFDRISLYLIKPGSVCTVPRTRQKYTTLRKTAIQTKVFLVLSVKSVGKPQRANLLTVYIKSLKSINYFSKV